ncbi:hypothetical protein FHG87_018877 [Trinorchestia longiramus]|nr:hypothetical protein FHG87_018877 [Trinorchestia longiramus]
MNQYAKRCPPSLGDLPAPLQVGGDLLTPTPRVLPTEQIRRTLARHSFADVSEGSEESGSDTSSSLEPTPASPTTGEVPNIFVVPPPPSKPLKSSSPSKDGRPPFDLESNRRRSSLGNDDFPLANRKLSSGSLPPPSTDGSSSPKTSPSKDRNPSPTLRVGVNQQSKTSVRDLDSSPPRRFVENHSTSSLPRLPHKREESHLARHSSPLPLKSSSRPSSRSNSPQLGDAIQPQPPIKRRVLPPIPANLTLSAGTFASTKSTGATVEITSSTSSGASPEFVTMRNKHVRTPSDPPKVDFSKKPQYGVGRSPSDPAHGDPTKRFRYPVGRNPPDGSSHSPRTSDGLKYDIPRESTYMPQREFRRLSQQDIPPRNQREELLRGQPDFHRSLSNLHASHRKADPMLMSQDSLDDISPSNRGGFDSKERVEYRGPPYGASVSPDRRRPEGVQRAAPRVSPPDQSPVIKTPTHESSNFQNSPTVISNRQASTLPRRPHSMHGDLMTSGNYGSLQRPLRDLNYPIAQTPASETNIMPQPTRAAPTTVNQILYGSANSASRSTGVVYAGQEHSPEGTLETWEESSKDYEVRGSPPRITSGTTFLGPVYLQRAELLA